MQTNEQALLSVWLWTSDLDSEVLFVRDYSDLMRTVKVAPQEIDDSGRPVQTQKIE